MREKVLGMLKMLANPRMMLLLPMMFFTGLNNTFYAAWFTRQILSCHTGLVLLALGAGEMVGAYMAGACPPCSKPRAARLMCPPPRKNRRHGEEWPENRSVLRDCDAGCRALPLRLCQQQRRLHQFLCACRSSSSPPSAPPHRLTTPRSAAWSRRRLLSAAGSPPSLTPHLTLNTRHTTRS